MLTKNELKESIKKLDGVKMLVIGDLAIDEMIYGDTERISREAPVLILAHTHTNIILGGASNAAHNLATLNNAKVSVIGLYGDDYHAPILIEAFKQANINTEYLVQDKSRPTTVKTRISGACSQSVTQQIVRIDRQSKDFVDSQVEAKLIENIKKAIPEHDGIILSDYHLGTLTQKVIDTTIEYAKKYNKTISLLFLVNCILNVLWIFAWHYMNPLIFQTLIPNHLHAYNRLQKIMNRQYNLHI